ncbi:MAG: TIGR01212 family radical SAM protein [bacterium]|uniref:TIGR01212 family radical SAM protein n=1 Tax=Candidatus Aphodosoma intestinipullorum TaxID=2840674 RepID=A0A940IDR3_9BACT|nr:TIGR01212 family radical SAM protein [Candidatus Aphodosoma intestinipullorum]
MTDRYNNYNETLRCRFGCRVQKISINAGFTCPNRDGTKGRGGCTFCNNQTFFPEYCSPQKSAVRQMEEGMHFFRRYEGQKYLAYFQAYTNTYAPLETLRRLYEPVLEMEDVVGIVVGTRPDCVDGPLLDYFAELSERCYVMVEYGVESTDDRTLRRINRGHSFAESVWAIEETARRGISVGAHLILGLPGESRVQMFLRAETMSSLPLDMVKLHQLQIVRGTAMAREYEAHPERFHLFTAEEYVGLCVDFIAHLDCHIGIGRFVSQSPKGMLVAPDWGLKNYEFVAMLEKALARRDVRQGKLCRSAIG